MNMYDILWKAFLGVVCCGVAAFVLGLFCRLQYYYQDNLSRRSDEQRATYTPVGQPSAPPLFVLSVPASEATENLAQSDHCLLPAVDAPPSYEEATNFTRK